MIPPLDLQADGYPHGPRELVLVGPPGTGKTRAVLEAWLAPAVQDGPAEEVLGCSFTRAAAREMRGRLQNATGAPFSDLMLTCRTIHSECLRLCREVDASTGIYDDREGSGPSTEGEEDEECSSWGWDGLDRPEADLRKEAIRVWHLVRHRWPADLLDDVPRQYLLPRVESSALVVDLEAEIAAYEARKAEQHKPDFTDLLYQAFEIAAPRRRLIVVDEAQDLSPLQILVVRKWAKAAGQLVWVGDPDQGIFSFAGADGAHLTALIRGGTPARSLQRSWRVPVAAHRLARQLITLNRDRVDAPYEPAREPGTVRHCNWPEDAAEETEALSRKGRSVFILARTGRALKPYAAFLAGRGVPYSQERGGTSPLRKRKLCLVVAALDGLLHWRGIGLDAVRALVEHLPGRPKGRHFAGTKKASSEALKEAADRGIESWERSDLEAAGVKLDLLHPEKTVDAALERIGLLDEARPLLALLQAAGGDVGVLTRRPWITLTTIHGAKGREADHVIVDLDAPLPSMQEITTFGAESERRTLYVALTRTKGGLTLVHPWASENDLGDALGLDISPPGAAWGAK